MSVYKKDWICERLKPLGHFDYREITTFLEIVRAAQLAELSKLTNELAAIENDEDDTSWLKQFAVEHKQYILEETQELLSELIFVALYKKVELRIQRVLQVAYPNENLKQTYRINRLRELLKERGIELDSIMHFESFSLLRRANNAIKHIGDLQDVIAEASDVFGESIVSTDTLYNSVSRRIPLFVEFFVFSVEENVGCFTALRE